jgi:uncharacterized protein involved in type VI secretion and phage assembly
VSLFTLPSEKMVERESRQKIYGVCCAIVTNNQDDQGLYRVKVRFPWLPNGGQQGGEESDWCRIATIGAGKDRGMFTLPEVDDEVLVCFEHGDIARPYIIGSLWNSQSSSHRAGNKKDDDRSGKNDVRSFKSRSGHKLEFDDKAGEEKINIQAKSGAKLEIDDKGGAKKISILDEKGDNYVVIDTQNKKITIETKTGDMLLKAKGTIRLEAKTIETVSDKDTTMKAGANLDMKAQSNFTLKAGGSGEVNSSGTLTIKGSTVNIN